MKLRHQNVNTAASQHSSVRVEQLIRQNHLQKISRFSLKFVEVLRKSGRDLQNSYKGTESGKFNQTNGIIFGDIWSSMLGSRSTFILLITTSEPRRNWFLCANCMYLNWNRVYFNNHVLQWVYKLTYVVLLHCISSFRVFFVCKHR